MVHELYRKYRPRGLEDIVGQDAALNIIQSWFTRKEIPHAILISGPSGTGKTTALQIVVLIWFEKSYEECLSIQSKEIVVFT
jgi:replication factor C small subunit